MKDLPSNHVLKHPRLHWVCRQQQCQSYNNRADDITDLDHDNQTVAQTGNCEEMLSCCSAYAAQNI
jgi:hypothetical protein